MIVRMLEVEIPVNENTNCGASNIDSYDKVSNDDPFSDEGIVPILR